MRSNHLVIVPLFVCAAALLGQDYAGDHVRFLVQQLDQWTRDFPQAFNAALLKPPVDASKLPETAKGGADEFSRSVKRLVELSGAKDVLTNAAFKGELQKTLGQFPLFRFWGPGADIVSSQWIGRCALHVFDRFRPTLTVMSAS